MKILITGANGFLGSHLTKHLLGQHHEICAMSLHTNRLNSVLNDIKFIPCNMDNIIYMKKEICEFGPHAVIHCAWHGGNCYASAQSPQQFRENIPGLVNLMEILKNIGTPKFIGIGSGAEYGNNQDVNLESTPDAPISLYGACKVMAKIYTETFCNINNITWNWIRPIYTYGPDDVQTRLIPSVILKSIRGNEVLLDECKSIVDYLYISDFVNGVECILNHNINGVFNICSSNAYSIREIIEKIGNLTNNTENIKFGVIPERNEVTMKILGSNENMKLYMGWTPTVSITEGLTKTIEFYKKS